MKKKSTLVLLIFCLLLSCFTPCLAAETEQMQEVCLHEKAEWELLFPSTPFTEAYYVRTCPDCSFRQTAKKARTAWFSRAFDCLSRLCLLFGRCPAGDDFLVTAHTGPWEIKQNSVFSLRYCLQSGADAVELDLALNGDGEAVMAHTTSGESGGNLLRDAFAMIAEYVDTQVNIDVKDTGALAQAQQLAVEYGLIDRCFYTGLVKRGFYSGNIQQNCEAARKDSPLIPYYLNVYGLGQDYEALCEEALSLGAIGLNLDYTACSRQLVEAAHEHGLLVSLYTPNTLRDMQECIRCGADSITTEFPYKLYTVV